MKAFLRKTAVAAAILLSATSFSFTANAQGEKLVYHKDNDAAIGITVENATGAEFVIRDKKGRVVHRGIVKSARTFYISTEKLNKGDYQFQIGNLVLQEFSVR